MSERFLRPELDIAVLTQTSSLDELSLFPHEILDGDLAVAKDIQMVADDVAVSASGAGNKRRAVVVALLGDVVVGAVAAGHAGEGQLVVRLLDLWPLTLALGLLSRLGLVAAGPRVLWRRRAGDRMRRAGGDQGLKGCDGAGADDALWLRAELAQYR